MNRENKRYRRMAIKEEENKAKKTREKEQSKRNESLIDK